MKCYINIVGEEERQASGEIKRPSRKANQRQEIQIQQSFWLVSIRNLAFTFFIATGRWYTMLSPKQQEEMISSYLTIFFFF